MVLLLLTFAYASIVVNVCILTCISCQFSRIGPKTRSKLHTSILFLTLLRFQHQSPSLFWTTGRCCLLTILIRTNHGSRLAFRYQHTNKSIICFCRVSFCTQKRMVSSFFAGANLLRIHLLAVSSLGRLYCHISLINIEICTTIMCRTCPFEFWRI